MAKKKTAKKKQPAKKKTEKSKGSSPFMRQAFAFLLILLSVFILLGGLGWGGKLPVALFDIASWLVGVSAYVLVPIIVVYLAVQKLKHEDNIIPFSKLTSSFAGLAALAASVHVFADRTMASDIAGDGEYGGTIGHLVSSVFLAFLNTATAFILLAVLALIAFLFTFGISPKAFLGAVVRPLRALFTRKPKEKKETTDLAELKTKKQSKFKLNKGVPVESKQETAPAKETPIKKAKVSLKNSMDKDLNLDQAADALTLALDPDWKFPKIDLLNQKQDKADAGNVQENAETIRETLANFNIDAEMEGANIGPRVTQYTLKPPSGIKLTKITSLESNIALDLAAQSIRIEAPIPGKRAVGIEVPNKKSATVRLSSLLSSREWTSAKAGGLNFTIGKDIAGLPELGSLEKMPHLLIAGQTGSGKSVMINTLLTSMLYRLSPSELKLILVDPKQVELTPYNDIPHLLTPVITQPEKCISALKWAVAEMERRLRTFADAGKRNISEYNNLPGENHMPYVVIVIDELADLMMMAARDVEALIVRIAQKARAAGIHLVLATQRPSVDVITGLIKANVPARIAFTVASQVDSRTIIDQVGAEKLLGMGDMLFSTSQMPKPKRVQGAFIDDDETMKVCDFLRQQRPPQYDDEVVSQPVQFNGKGGVVAPMDGSGMDADDDMWRDAVTVVVEGGKASTSLLQRRLRIGYARAARIIESMEEQGIIGPADGSRPREVLVGSLEDVFGGGDAEPDGTDEIPLDDQLA
ncbi:MAG: DNA translocase FtsK 4TM domain-containing protein [Patescibacteria group bacterium]